MRVAVVGAGVCGLTAASLLDREGLEVLVIDKGRGVGGRCTTRYANELRFDHGAQYFTVGDERFAGRVESWRSSGVVQPWDTDIVVAEKGRWRPTETELTRWVGVPGMNAIAQELAKPLRVETNRRIDRLERVGQGWRLYAEADAGKRAATWDADLVIVTTPAPQALPLLQSSPQLCSATQAVEIAPVWAVLVSFAQPLDLPFGGAFARASALSWIARNCSKPGRPAHECWVLHATHEWSKDNLEAEQSFVVRELLAAFREASGLAEVCPEFCVAHRWRYAQPAGGLDLECLWDAALGIGAGGDWCFRDGRIEGAFLSGWHLAHRVLRLG